MTMKPTRSQNLRNGGMYEAAFVCLQRLIALDRHGRARNALCPQ
jgi:hypothetical protein